MRPHTEHVESVTTAHIRPAYQWAPMQRRTSMAEIEELLDEEFENEELLDLPPVEIKSW